MSDRPDAAAHARMRRRRTALRHALEEGSDLFGRTLFVDLLMGTLIIFMAALPAMMLAAAAPKSEAKKDRVVNSLGEYVLVMTWPDDSLDDVDLYVRDPRGTIVFFKPKESSLLHLERDDKGQSGDSVTFMGNDYTFRRNEEHMFFRVLLPGEYTVNAHLFLKFELEYAEVTMKLLRLSDGEEIVSRTRDLVGQGAEETFFRFTFTEGGDVTDINERPDRFVGPSGRGGH